MKESCSYQPLWARQGKAIIPKKSYIITMRGKDCGKKQFPNKKINNIKI